MYRLKKSVQTFVIHALIIVFLSFCVNMGTGRDNGLYSVFILHLNLFIHIFICSFIAEKCQEPLILSSF